MRHRVLLVVLLAGNPSFAQTPAPSFAGSWETTYGPMTLTVEGAKLTGFFVFDGVRSTLEGKLEKNRFTFTYREPSVQGEGWFELAADGKSFSGKWREKGQTAWGEWTGARAGPAAGFAGVWETRWGSMRLIENLGRIHGIYGSGGKNTVEGKMDGKKYVFRYVEPDAVGEGWFELAADRKSFTGKWRANGTTAWADWNGTRVTPVPGRSWLVVLEANWENDLREQEYSFGGMLRAFFKRSAAVQVRHRFFTDSASLGRWCREIAYIPEPVVLSIATHGSPAGAAVDGKTIGARALADYLKDCDNIKLLHFSACLMMKDRLASEMVKALDRRVAFPISGYTTSVEWAASAVIEFLYFDMVLMRRMTVKAAAEQLPKLMPFAGDTAVPGTALSGAGFKILFPPAKSAAR